MVKSQLGEGGKMGKLDYEAKVVLLMGASQGSFSRGLSMGLVEIYIFSSYSRVVSNDE